MVSIRFEDPPDPIGRVVRLEPRDMVKNRDRDQIVAALSSHPGRWARVSEHRSRAAAAKVARLLRLRFPGIEFKTALVVGGAAVYGRFPSQT